MLKLGDGTFLPVVRTATGRLRLSFIESVVAVLIECDLPNDNPDNVYKVGLTAAFNGSTNTAIQANTCGGIRTPNRDTIPNVIMGIQQKKSVITMNIIRRAIRFCTRVS